MASMPYMNHWTTNTSPHIAISNTLIYCVVYRGVLTSELIFVPKHITGHQDNSVHQTDLDRLTQLNVEMDYWAEICAT